MASLGKISLPTTPSFASHTSTLIDNFAKTRPIHANSLILSIYGDTICPRGDTIWLGSLIKLVEPLGISQRLVRTSVFRLSEKNVLQSKQVGRRSYYSLTNRAFRQFITASKRIYAAQPLSWDGQWRLVFTSLGGITTEQREMVRKELNWLGFNRITAGVYGHPTADIDDVKKLTRELDLEDNIVILQATAASSDHVPLANKLISQCFDLDSSNEQYTAFIKDFETILAAAHREQTLDPKLCFLIKTLLIHRFRHILLKEPALPQALLPENALSLRARDMVGSLYQMIQEPADRYFTEVSETEGGEFKQAPADYFLRFKE